MPQKDILHSFLETLSGPEKGVFEFLMHLDQKVKHHSPTEQVIVSWRENERQLTSEQLMHALTHEGSVKPVNGIGLTWMEIHQGDHQSLAVGSSHLKLYFDDEMIVLQSSAGSMRGMEESCARAFDEMNVPVVVTENMTGGVTYVNEAYKRQFE